MIVLAKSKKADEAATITNEDATKAVRAESDNKSENENVKHNAQIEDDGSAAESDAMKKAIADEKDKYIRLAAEYDNFRKRSAKEREMIYGDARADTITKLLPVYDNLERALKMECEDEAYYKGVEMTMTQLMEILENMGVRKIPALGKPFDPNRHNAVMTIEDPELGEKIIADEFQTGFVLGDRVIRHSTAVVAN